MPRAAPARIPLPDLNQRQPLKARSISRAGTGVSPWGPGGNLPWAYFSGVKAGPKTCDRYAVAAADTWPRGQVIGGWWCTKAAPDAPWIRQRTVIAGVPGTAGTVAQQP